MRTVVGIEDRNLVRLLNHLHAEIPKKQMAASGPTLVTWSRVRNAAQRNFVVLLHDLRRRRLDHLIGCDRRPTGRCRSRPPDETCCAHLVSTLAARPTLPGRSYRRGQEADGHCSMAQVMLMSISAFAKRRIGFHDAPVAGLWQLAPRRDGNATMIVEREITASGEDRKTAKPRMPCAVLPSPLVPTLVAGLIDRKVFSACRRCNPLAPGLDCRLRQRL
jgi:hypothetical protein